MERVILRHLKGSKASQLEEFPLQEFAELVFGRDPGSNVRFDPDKDDLVGRQHARIVREPNDPYRFKLVDLNSRNGTYLNKLRVVGDMPLLPGDVIQLGAGGPEIQFDIDPLPAAYLKATRLGNVGAPGATAQVNETRVGSAPAPVSGAVGGAPAGGIGKATVERMITDTKRQTNRRLQLVGGVAAAMLMAVVAWSQAQKNRLQDDVDQQKKDSQSEMQRKLEAERARLDSVNRANSARAGITPTEIAARYSNATVAVDFSWNLIYAPTGAQVFHRYVPNAIKLRNGRTVPLIAGAGSTIPAYIAVTDDQVEPYLTLDASSGSPIAVNGSGSGFVVTSTGFILTNRHVAANWRAPYRFGDNDGGVLVNANGEVLLDRQGNVMTTNPPQRWVPSETRQTGPKGEIEAFRGRQEYLYVRFRKNTNPVDATVARVSDQHDVALMKIETPSSLEPVVLNDNYKTLQVGDQVTVLGYPGLSDEVVAVVKSKDTFNREAQVRTVPDPTLSAGNIGKILRAADGPATDAYATYAPYGDRYQLTINSTGGGNSGGPMFDNTGRVIGIYFAGRSADAQVSFAVPIQFGMQLMTVTPNTK